jgi:hypothetical protein
MQNPLILRPPGNEVEPLAHWMGEPIETFSGAADEALKRLPEFGRRPFTVPNITGAVTENAPAGVNQFLDVIVRLPAAAGGPEMPVGVVSKKYKLVQHRELFQSAVEAMKELKVLEAVKVALTLTVYASRMAARFTLPDEYAFDPGDGEKLMLRFECFNSVDASTRLTVMLGWFRFVCSNGLVLGTTRLKHRAIHNEFMEVPNLSAVLRDGIRLAEEEKNNYKRWFGTNVELPCVREWVNGALKEQWGALAAARTWLICTAGCDGAFADPFEKARPDKKKMIKTTSVPGSTPPARNAYQVCQAIAWVAKERADLQAQLERMREIPELMKVLLG